MEDDVGEPTFGINTDLQILDVDKFVRGSGNASVCSDTDH